MTRRKTAKMRVAVYRTGELERPGPHPGLQEMKSPTLGGHGKTGLAQRESPGGTLLTRHLSTLHGHPSPPSPLLPLASGLTQPVLFYLIIQGAARCLHLVLLLLRLAPSPAASQMWVASWDPEWQLEVSLAGGSRREGWWRCPGLIAPYGLFGFPLASRPDLG